MAEEDLADELRDAAQKPASGSNDQGAFSQHNLRDLIAADKHLKASTAARTRPARGLRFNKLIPPGTA